MILNVVFSVLMTVMALVSFYKGEVTQGFVLLIMAKLYNMDVTFEKLTQKAKK